MKTVNPYTNPLLAMKKVTIEQHSPDDFQDVTWTIPKDTVYSIIVDGKFKAARVGKDDLIKYLNELM